MDSTAYTFALVWAVACAALGCGAGERFRTAPKGTGAGGASAAAGEAGRAAAAEAGAGVTAGAGQAAMGGEPAGAGQTARAGASPVAGGSATPEGGAPVGAGGVATLPGGVAGTVEQGGATASGGAPTGGAGGSSNLAGASGGEPPGGSAGADGAAGSAGARAVDLSGVAEEYAQAACEALKNCSLELVSITFGANDCVTYVAAQVTNAWIPGLEDAIKEGTVGYSRDALDLCLAEKIPNLGRCEFDLDENLRQCTDAFQGTLESGESCKVDAECKAELYCKAKADGACPGTCSAREGADEQCRRDTDCTADRYCLGGYCANKTAAAGACDREHQCVPGALCVGADPSASKLGHCEMAEEVFIQTEYGTCDIGQGELCAGGLSCTFTTGYENEIPTCRQRASSEPTCRLAIPDPCPRDRYCNGVSFDAPISLVGSCAELPGAGAACLTDLGFGKLCAAGLVCVDGTCLRIGTNGEECHSDDECYSGACAAGLCVPLTTACDA